MNSGGDEVSDRVQLKEVTEKKIMLLYFCSPTSQDFSRNDFQMLKTTILPVAQVRIWVISFITVLQSPRS